MNKSTILGIGLIAAIPLYCGATWITGNIARDRMDQAISRVTDQAHGMIKIASRRSKINFFTAAEDITLELDNPALNTLLNAGANDKPATQFVIHNDITYG